MAPMPSLDHWFAALDGLYTYPYRLFVLAITISIIILAFNLFGDGLRDAFDPKLMIRRMNMNEYLVEIKT